ncbi:MAG: hypothetical protein INH41_12090 [Myxococcaceae bacterium]|jgi:hypothetical protein|nr:hypothetical protein [Myxococcaceae bacterium]MCA3013125.1 hypothetical protein [Myxococcaceae bacterium]
MKDRSLWVVLVMSCVAQAQQPPAADAPPTARPSETGATATGASNSVVPMQSREVVERLKTMRAQLLLDQEYNRLLEARLKRYELEEKLGIDSAQAKRKDVPSPPPRLAAAPPRLDSGEKDLVVKSVTVAPFKEAFVVYKGRVYTVRPGDKLGDLVVRDVTEVGVVTNRSTVAME